MQITLYNLAKRRNSTKQPSKGSNITVKLKEGTSYFNPSFILNSNPTGFNYLSWDGRFYYITNIENTRNGIYTISCELDVLATYKNDILNTNAFVVYSSSNYDISIPDTRLSTKSKAIINSNAVTYPINGSPAYVISYIGENGASLKAISPDSLVKLQNALSSNGFAELFTDSSNAISKMLTNTGSAITGCTYVPRCSTTGRPTKLILAGGYDTGISGTSASRLDFATISINIPWNFQNNDFRNRSQYTTIIVLLPCYGYLQLNTDNYVNESSITIDVFQDSATGNIAYIGRDFYCVGSMGSNMQISTTTQGSLSGVASGIASAVGYGAAGNLLGIATGAFNAITSSMSTNIGSVGSVGNTVAFPSTLNVEVQVISHDTNVNPSTMATNYGRPCNKVLSLSGLSGYVQTANANVITGAAKEYKDEIDSLLNGGVYIE